MKWFENLNSQQREVVAHSHGPLLVLAGAGSGKTTVLVRRLGRLIAEGIVAPENLLALTFTNKAARELKHRLAEQTNTNMKGMFAGTFHSFGLNLLKKHGHKVGLNKGFSIIDAADAASLIKDLIKDIKIPNKDKFDADKLLNMVNLYRIGKKENHQAFDEYEELTQILAPKYVRRLELLNLVDFEGLLLKPIELLSENLELRQRVQEQCRFLSVDEFQDTNKLQMDLIHLLTSAEQNLMVVGDDDQSIYGWRGAEINNILSFPKNFANCKVIKLEQNYRSTPGILNFANYVIAQNKRRHGKILKSNGYLVAEQTPEIFTMENEEDEAKFVVSEIRKALQQGIKPTEIAVLYRSNTQGAYFETAMRENQIDYNISGGTSIFDRKEIKDCIAYLRLAFQTHELSMRRVYNIPARGIGEVALEKLHQYSQTKACNFYQACLAWKAAGLPEKIGESLESLFKFLQKFRNELLNSSLPIHQVVCTALSELGYREYLSKISNDGEAAQNRWQLVEVFSRILENYINKRARRSSEFQDFFEAMTLREEDDEEAQGVQLMTLHASKGLEFSLVLLTGVEEDILPHRRLGSDVDEERRLFYVGVTRAKRHLILTHCRERHFQGRLKPAIASRFILQLPADLVRHFPRGVRPVQGEQRDRLVGDFLSKLASKQTKTPNT